LVSDCPVFYFDYGTPYTLKLKKQAVLMGSNRLLV
jgi:hypothetical protein